MSALGPDRVPTLDDLEYKARLVTDEAERLLDLVRDMLRELQDLEAETADGADPTRGTTRSILAYRLRGLARMFELAQLELVHRDDPRFAGVERGREKVKRAGQRDVPWADAERAA